MKKLISLTLAILLAFSCFAIAGNAFWGGAMPEYKDGTFNASDYSTKYVTTKSIYKDADGSGSTSTYSYDANGNVVKQVYKSGSTTSTTTYSYDKNGNILKRSFKNSNGYNETESFSYSGGKLKKQTYQTNDGDRTNKSSNTYSYNSKGLLTKTTFKDSDGEDSYTYNYSYNKAGYVSKMVFKNPGSTPKTTLYTYDSKNRLTKAVSDNDEGSTTTKYTYDSKGNITKIVCESANEYAAFTTNSTYDKNGNLLTEKTVTGSGETYNTKKAYDSKGRMIKESYTSAGDYAYTWKIKYDSKGCIAKETFESSGGVSTTTYEYKKLSKPIVKVNQVSLSYASTTYDGKAKEPVVQVRGASNGADYRVEYLNNKKPGIASVKIIFNLPEMGVITVNFEIKPAKATNLKVTAKTKSSLTLKWDKVVGAKKYIVYQAKSDGTYKKLATVTSNKATLKNLKAKTSYKLCVVAVTSGGLKSAYSAKLSAKTSS